MARPKPKDVDFFTALGMLSERERKIVMVYVECRVCVIGAGEDEMSPVELMAWLTRKPGERGAT